MPVPGSSNKGLALGIAFTATGTTAFAAIACLDCRVPGDDVLAIANQSSPRSDRLSDKERLRDGLKSLINSLAAKDAEEIGAKSAKLVDAYHDIIDVCWSVPNAVVRPSGELDGWRWAITKGRFERWITDVAVVSSVGFAGAPGKPVNVNALPPAAPMSMVPPPSAAALAPMGDFAPADPLGPAPGTETKGKKKK